MARHAAHHGYDQPTATAHHATKHDKMMKSIDDEQRAINMHHPGSLGEAHVVDHGRAAAHGGGGGGLGIRETGPKDRTPKARDEMGAFARAMGGSPDTAKHVKNVD